MLKKVKEKDKNRVIGTLLELDLFITFFKSLVAVPLISILRVNQTHYRNCCKMLLR
jgi:hypothetical protein